jgi:multiple sugar transport system substrate-binding protein
MPVQRDFLGQIVSRRAMLRRATLAVTAALPLLAACGQAPSQQKPAAPAAEPKPTTAAQSVPKAAEAAKPAAPAAQPAATTAAKPAAQPAAQQAPGKPAGPVTVKYLTWWWAEKGRNDAWRATVEKFHASQNDIRIEEVGFPYSEFFQKVMTQVAGGKLDADALSFYDEIAIRLIKSGQLEPMDSVADKLGVRGKLLQPSHELVTTDGRLYGMLATQTPYALIYNKELYEKEGIAKAPASQDEYFEVAKKVTRRPDQFGHASRSTMPEQNGWWQDITQWVLGYGGVWAKDKKPLATSEPVLKAVRAYKRLYDEAMPQGADASTYRRMAWEGKIVQYVDNAANMNILRSGNPDIYPKILTAPPPWENRQSIAIPSFVGIYAGSDKKDAAKAWWEFVFKQENIQDLVEQALDIIPPYEGAIREAYVKELPWASGFQAAKGIVFISVVEGFEANAAEFRQTVLQKVSEVLTAGKDPEVAMKEAQQGLEELAARI